MIIGLAGIIAALVLLIWMVYKGWPVLVAAAAAAIIVALSNQISATEGYSSIYMNGIGSFVVGNLPIYLWGAIFGQMYNASGAASSIAQGISRLFKGKKETISSSTGILIIFAAGVVMSYGGISGIVLMFVMMPLGLEILKECNVPRYMAPGILLGSMATAALCMPGSPQIQNASPMTFLGTSSTAALIPGFIGGIVVLTLNYFYLTYSAKKEIAKGNGFEVLDKEKVTLDTVRECPGVLISLLPLILTFVLFNVFKVYIGFSIIAGIVASVVLFYNKIGSMTNVFKAMETGVLNACSLCFASAALSGFGAIVKETSAFVTLSEALTSINGEPLFIAMLAIMLITGICGSGPAGIGASLPMFKDTFVAMGINMSALHRVAAFSATTLDTLPTNAGFIAAAGLASTSTKLSYKYVGVCTVLNTTIATFVVALLLVLFPGLA